MIEASCHCGAIRFAVATAPEDLNDCGCSICRRYGALWAYYPPTEVVFAPDSGPTDIYMWGDHDLEFHRCRACGGLTHWAPADRAYPRMGVNFRMTAPEVLEAIPVRHTSGPD